MAAGLVTLTLEGVGSIQMWSSDGTAAGALTPVHLMDAAQLATLASQSTVEQIRVLLAAGIGVTGPLTDAQLAARNLATTAKQDTNTSAVNLVGTRAYGTALSRVAVASASAQSAAITATEVLVHASTRCFIKVAANPTATTDDIPLEAGEKFHLRITSGHKIAVLQDTAAGFLNIIPVA